MKYFVLAGYFFFFFLFVAPTHVFAYLDPGSGSYLLQLLIGFLVGGAVSIGLFFKRIKNFISSLLGRDKKEDDQ